MIQPGFDAIIFDCDGTLVDSEPITVGVLVDFVGEYAEMNTWVYADDENDACVVATNFMIDYYGVDMDKFQTVASECVSL